MAKTKLTDAQKEQISDLLTTYQDAWEALDDAGTILHENDIKLQIIMEPNGDYSGWDMGPRVDYSPGDYQDGIHQATMHLEKEMQRLEDLIRPPYRKITKKEREKDRKEQIALLDKALSR